MAAGRVITGFSFPTVAKYNANGGKPTYSDGMRLARGVKVSLDIETVENNDFYADNTLAESDGGEFKKGTATLTLDGMHDKAERLVFGIPEPEEINVGEGQQKVKITKHGRSANPPYLGIGFIIRWQSDGVETFQPIILTKGKFTPNGMEAETQNEEKEYQTQEVMATLARDDSTEKNWKWVVEEQQTEAAALAILNALLSVTEAANA